MLRTLIAQVSRGRYKAIFWRLVETAPLVVPVALAIFGAVAMLFLLADSFYSWLVWPFGLLAAAAASYYLVKVGTPQRLGSLTERRVCDLMLVVGVALWGGFNVLYTSEHIYTDRDPATYAVTATWLIGNTDLRIEKPTVFGDDPDLVAYSAGFGDDVHDKDLLFAQGNHLLPAMLAMGGRIVGDDRMLRLNVIAGMAALGAVYAFARLMMRSRWALVAVSALALTLPMIAFSRDTYTEPLTAAFAFAALTLLWMAQVKKKPMLWLMSGLLAGAGAMTRIDAYLTAAVFILVGFLTLALAVHGTRKRTAINIGLLYAGLAITSLIGWLDVTRLSSGYYVSEWPQLRLLFLLLAGVVVFGVMATAISWRTAILKHLHIKTVRWRPLAAAAAVVLVCLFLISRPLWQVSYGVFDNHQIDATPQIARTYAESTVNWLMWYLGPVFTILGGLGLAIAAARAMKRNDLLLLAPVLLIAGTSLLYLTRPSIYPDQIWATRRLLPVIMPGLAVFGAVALEWIYRQRLSKRLHTSSHTLVTVLATLAIIAPLFISMPFLFSRTYDPQLNQLKAACNELPDNSAVVWVGDARWQMVQPTSTFCKVPVVGVHQDVKDTQAALAKAAREVTSRGMVPVVGMFSKQSEALGLPLDQATKIGPGVYYVIEPITSKPPRNSVPLDKEVALGVIQPDGTFRPLSVAK